MFIRIFFTIFITKTSICLKKLFLYAIIVLFFKEYRYGYFKYAYGKLRLVLERLAPVFAHCAFSCYGNLCAFHYFSGLKVPFMFYQGSALPLSHSSMCCFLIDFCGEFEWLKSAFYVLPRWCSTAEPQ